MYNPWYVLRTYYLLVNMQCTASGSIESQFHQESPIRRQLQSQKVGRMHERLHS